MTTTIATAGYYNSNSSDLVCGNSSLNANLNYQQDWNWVESPKIVPLTIEPIKYNPPVSITTTGTTSLGILTINNNSIMQNKIAVFKVTRDENQKITSTTFLKEMWIESKNGSSIDFEVAKDPEISKYKADEIVIKNIYNIAF